VRQCSRARPQADEQQERDTGTAEPRRTAEHRFELSDSGCTASSIGKIDEQLRPERQCPRTHARDERI
jgi:hypothetical protein